MIIENVRKDNHIINKSSIIIVISFQRPIYKMLYIKKRVYKSYKNHFRMFYPLLIDKSESIAVIKIYK